MLQILPPVSADPTAVLTTFSQNLGLILGQLATKFPDAQIYVANYYDPKLPVPNERDLVLALNGVIAAVVGALNNPQIQMVDLFTAFDGRKGLLLIEKKGSDTIQIHPTNAGYRVITDAFLAAIKSH